MRQLDRGRLEICELSYRHGSSPASEVGAEIRPGGAARRRSSVKGIAAILGCFTSDSGHDKPCRARWAPRDAC